MASFTKLKMYRLYHIPGKYFLPNKPVDDLEVLANELDAKGFIDLDKDGEPCCLSGNEPIIKVAEFEGIITGDGSCWCLEVTEEQYRQACGEKKYQQELDFRKAMPEEFADDHHIFALYPGDLFRAIGCGDFPKGKVKFIMELIAHDPDVKSKANAEEEE